MNDKKKIMMSVALFVATMFGAGAQEPCPLHQVNMEIDNTRNSIDSVRNAYAGTMTRQLRRNSNYRYIRAKTADIDTLRRQNERLLDMAESLIHKHCPGVLIIRTPFMFRQYKHVPGVLRIGCMYRHNIGIIHEYDRRVAAFHPEYLEIKNRCDSALHRQIDMYQLRLDSLLNRKIELTR